VFNIEPGVYREGWGGVRLEDTFVMTEDGAVLLTGEAPEVAR
jgi:Xaa-Pro aminopeptidase